MAYIAQLIVWERARAKAIEKNNWAFKNEKDQERWEDKKDDQERWEEKKYKDKAGPGTWDGEKGRREEGERRSLQRVLYWKNDQ